MSIQAMTSEEWMDRDFRNAIREITQDPQAAAIIALAKAIARGQESLSHNICLGVRHGLFGIPMLNGEY